MNIYRPSAWLYVACYAIWFVLCAATFWLIVNLRSNLLDFAYLTGGRAEMVGLVDRLGIILLGILFIVIILVTEYKLRTGIEKGLLWKRAIKAVVILIGAIAISYVLQFAAMTLLVR